MNLTQEHFDFELFSRKLIGLTIIKVEYSEIDYDPTNPEPNYPTQFTNLDSIDFSIFLYTEKDKLEIYWDDQFFQYGIGLKINESSNFSGTIKWNVSNSELWAKFIGQTISDVKISWERVISTEEKTGIIETFVYSQNLKLTFSNNLNIFVSAAGFLNSNDNEVYGMMDNLTVTDSEELARKVKMIL